jgi:dTDP-6-deoxy-L-talose 4-dehydrogenase (NAD+)
MRKVLITGCTGFVGQQVLRYLSKSKIDLLMVVRDENLIPKINFSGPIRVVISKDLFHENNKFWDDVLTGIDTVIHLAWYTEPGKYLSSFNNLSCFSGTLAIANSAVRVGVRKFIGIGTCFEYDLSYRTLSAETPLLPTTLYSACKIATFNALKNLFLDFHIEFSWCRLFYLHGENENVNRLIGYVRSKLKNGDDVMLSEGDQVRDYLDVETVGRLISEISLGTKSGVINICSGVPITVRELVEHVASQYSTGSKLLFGAIDKKPFDPDYIVGVPNF